LRLAQRGEDRLVWMGPAEGFSLLVMRRPAVRPLLARYAVAWGYLVAVTVTGVVYLLLPGPARAAALRWASTNVHNLMHDPVGCLVASAFLPSGSVGAWPVLIALAMFPANRALGNWRTAAVCAAGHVIGTLVSEGIVGYRVDHGTLPVTARYITDVGPSYVVVSAVAAAIICGGWAGRAAGVADLAILTFIGNIFGGLTRLDVAAVGHLTALTVGVLGSLLILARRARRARRAEGRPAAGELVPAGAGSAAGGQAEAAAGRRAADQADQAAQPRPPA
jgi:hypothetical protein